jgi:hypothetical protein
MFMGALQPAASPALHSERTGCSSDWGVLVSCWALRRGVFWFCWLPSRWRLGLIRESPSPVSGATREQVSYKLKWGLPQSGGGRKASSQDMMMDDGKGCGVKGGNNP